MTAAFLLMSSAALAGADPAPTPAAPAPAVVHSGAGCKNCTPAPCGCEKPNLLDRLKAKFGKKCHDCSSAPVPAAAPVAPPAPRNACSPCSVADRPNLLDKLKSRLGQLKASHCGPVCDPCGARVAPATGGTTPPKEMPKPKDEKPKPKGGTSSSLPVPLPNAVGGLAVSGSPY